MASFRRPSSILRPGWSSQELLHHPGRDSRVAVALDRGDQLIKGDRPAQRRLQIGKPALIEYRIVVVWVGLQRAIGKLKLILQLLLHLALERALARHKWVQR